MSRVIIIKNTPDQPQKKINRCDFILPEKEKRKDGFHVSLSQIRHSMYPRNSTWEDAPVKPKDEAPTPSTSAKQEVQVQPVLGNPSGFVPQHNIESEYVKDEQCKDTVNNGSVFDFEKRDFYEEFEQGNLYEEFEQGDFYEEFEQGDFYEEFEQGNFYEEFEEDFELFDNKIL